MKRTLERELKVPENAQKEANETSCWVRIVADFVRDVSVLTCQHKFGVQGK